MKKYLLLSFVLFAMSSVFASDIDTKVYTDEDLKNYKSTSEIPKARGEVKSPLDLIKNECDSISSMSGIELEILLAKLDSAQDTINSMVMSPELKYNALLYIRSCREVVKIEFKLRKLKGY